MEHGNGDMRVRALVQFTGNRPGRTVYGGGQPSFYALYSSSDGLADTSWPMFHQNARHTGKWENVVIPLAVGDSAESIVPRGGNHYYSVEPDADQALLIELMPGVGANDLLLTGQLGASTFSTALLTPNGTYDLLISPTAATPYTLTIYGADVGDNGGADTLTASYVEHHLSDLSPRVAGNAGEARLEITGLSSPAQCRLPCPDRARSKHPRFRWDWTPMSWRVVTSPAPQPAPTTSP